MTDAIRIVALLAGGAALGMTLLIFVLYHQAWRHASTSGIVSPHHVAYIGTAHTFLIIGLMASILARVQRDDTFSWWVTPFALVGFSLTLFALVQLLRSHRLRELHAEVSAHIHSS